MRCSIFICARNTLLISNLPASYPMKRVISDVGKMRPASGDQFPDIDETGLTFLSMTRLPISGFTTGNQFFLLIRLK